MLIEMATVRTIIMITFDDCIFVIHSTNKYIVV